MPYPTPCKHTNGESLCDDCRAAFEEDADGYQEFGAHPQGDANYRALLAEIADHNRKHPEEPLPLPPGEEIPY